MRLLDKARVRMAWVVVGVVATATGVVLLNIAPVLPVLGVAVATLALAVHGVASRIKADACKACGASLARAPIGEHGVMCPGCGQLQDPPSPNVLALATDETSADPASTPTDRDASSQPSSRSLSS